MNNEPPSSNSQTDWQRLDAMSDEDIDLSDCPEITPEMFAKAVVRRGLPATKAKTQVTLRTSLLNFDDRHCHFCNFRFHFRDHTCAISATRIATSAIALAISAIPFAVLMNSFAAPAPLLLREKELGGEGNLQR